MVTKEQAFEALNRVQNGASDGWQSFDLVRRFIEQSQPVPEGYALVPVEPTREMLVDGAKTARDFLWEAGPYPRSRAVYRAMLAAAPKPGADND